jgi:hypothetical protein
LLIGYFDLCFLNIPAMSWSLKFDEPIELAKDKPLRTLRDAGNYITALSKKEVVLPHWQLAAQCLLAAVEKGGGLVMMARIAMVRALRADNPEHVLMAAKKAGEEVPDRQLKADHYEAMSHPVWPQLIPDIRSGVFPAFSNGTRISLISTGATVCFSRLELTLHGSSALSVAADVVVLPLHTRHRHRQHAMTCRQRYP